LFRRDGRNFLKSWWFTIDKKILSLFLLFSVFGLLVVFSASIFVANRINASTEYFFLKKHIIFTSISIIITIVISFFNEKTAKFSIPFYFAISVLLLLVTHFIGYNVKGSQRWVYLFGFSLQASEFIKPSFIMLNAFVLALMEKNKKVNKLIFLNIILLIIIIYLLYKQPDVGNCCLLLFAMFSQIFFLNNFTKKILVRCCCGFLILFIIMYLSFSHVYSRINNFVISFSNVDKAQYQVKSSIRGYRNSGLLGRGFMEGEVKKHIPDAHTDFILPVISEEFGFFVVFLILTGYFYLFCRILLKSLIYEDKTIFFILIGLSFLFVIQMLINVGVSLNLLPTKGMTIPFISYGGSSLISNAISFGYILIFTKDGVQKIKKVETITDA
jgi:cell division protein FtsW